MVVVLWWRYELLLQVSIIYRCILKIIWYYTIWFLKWLCIIFLRNSPETRSSLSYIPVTVLHDEPSPPHCRHMSSLAFEPSIISHPTGYKFNLKKYNFKIPIQILQVKLLVNLPNIRHWHKRPKTRRYTKFHLRPSHCADNKTVHLSACRSTRTDWYLLCMVSNFVK